MVGSLRASLIAFVLVTMALSPTHASAREQPGGGGRIAFSSDRDGNFEIYTMKPDGSDVRRLTNDPADDEAPAWSPDGTKIAFCSDRATPGSFEIYVMNADGTDPHRITFDPSNNGDPTWSPGRFPDRV